VHTQLAVYLVLGCMHTPCIVDGVEFRSCLASFDRLEESTKYKTARFSITFGMFVAYVSFCDHVFCHCL
jgi:hypothetical protein